MINKKVDGYQVDSDIKSFPNQGLYNLDSDLIKNVAKALDKGDFNLGGFGFAYLPRAINSPFIKITKRILINLRYYY